MKRSLEDLLNMAERLMEEADEGQSVTQRSFKQRQSQTASALAQALAIASVVKYEDKVRKES